MEIKAQNLSKRFNREWIFRELNYSFSSGNTYAITGPNGSGKSTLLQVLWGQMPPSSGSLSFIDSNSNLIPAEEFYRNISIATPYMDLIDELTLFEQLNFHFNIKKSRNGMSVDQIIAAMDLEISRDKPLSNFSSGMKQRVKLGIAFFTYASVIFLDEPGTNLDHKAFNWYEKQLNDLPESMMVFIASNQPAEYPQKSHIISIFDYK